MLRLIENEVFKIFANKKFYVFVLVLLAFSLLPALEYVLGAIDFTLNGQNLPLYMLATINSIIPIFIIVTLGDLITDEYVSGTLKLPLLHPVSRTKFLTAKLLALVVPITLLLLLGMLVSYILGTVLFGWGTELLFNELSIPTLPGLMTTLGAYLSSILPLMVFAAVIMFICLHFTSSGAAVATSIGLLLILSVVGQLSAGIRPYLVITYFSEFPDSLFFTGDLSKIIQALLVFTVYAGSSFLGSIYVFRHKDLLY